jgi:hypothetical protein
VQTAKLPGVVLRRLETAVREIDEFLLGSQVGVVLGHSFRSLLWAKTGV